MATMKSLNEAVKDSGQIVPQNNTLKALLSTVDIKARFEEVLGKRASSFMSSIMSAVATNPALKSCDPMSVISSAMVAATLDLPINSSLGLAYIVPYSGKAQFQASWRTYVQLAQRSGLYETINVSEVYEGELVFNNRHTGEMFFDVDKKVSDKIIGYVAYFKLLNGFKKYLYMTKEEVEKHGRRYSKSYSSGQWAKDFDAMAKKTVLKMLLGKYGPLSVDIQMQKAIEVDQATVKEDGTVESYPDNTAKDSEVEFPSIEEVRRENIEASKSAMPSKTREDLLGDAQE